MTLNARRFAQHTGIGGSSHIERVLPVPLPLSWENELGVELSDAYYEESVHSLAHSALDAIIHYQLPDRIGRLITRNDVFVRP